MTENILSQSLPYILGPGGALFILLAVGWKGYNFFTAELGRLNARYEKQEGRLIELHKTTLEALKAHTVAVEKLTLRISACSRHKS